MLAIDRFLFKYETYQISLDQMQISITISIPKYLNSKSTMIKTACAFHQGHFIVQFCKCQTCLLPLCQECLVIHRQEHQSGMPQPMQSVAIQSAVKQINFAINNQFKSIQSIVVQTINKYRESDELHRRLFQQVLHHRDISVHAVHAVYENIFQELESNGKRRQAWIRDFNESVTQLKQQLNSMINSLMSEKYLRTVIMWNRMKPHQAIEQISKKAEKKWVVPSFLPCNQQSLINFIQNNINLKVLQIEGDSGIKKILHLIKVLRYGDQQSSSKSFHLSGVEVVNPITVAKQNISSASSPTHQVGNNQHLSPTQNPLFFNSPTRKNLHKKLQVLSVFDQHRASKVLENR